MKRRARNLLFCVALPGLLAACDSRMQVENNGPVRVDFAQPFPADTPDLTAFLRRDRQQLILVDDTASRLVITAKALMRNRSGVVQLPKKEADSLGISTRPGWHHYDTGLLYETLAATADSCVVRVTTPDTLVSLNGKHSPRVRYYGGWYYLNTPDQTDSTKWQVERIGLLNNKFCWQAFNTDSLRIRALDPASRQSRRAAGILLFTLTPQSGRAIRQLHSYAGLWLTQQEYFIKPFKIKTK